MNQVFDLIGAVFLLIGTGFTAIAAIGLFRFHDLFSRMHAASKPQLLGLTIISIGLLFTMREWRWFLICTVVIAIQMLAAPVASHLMARSAYRTGVGQMSDLVADELRESDQSSSSDQAE